MSFCANCGAELAEGTAICPYCGAGQARQFNPNEPQVLNSEPVYQQPVYQPSVEATATLTGAAKILSIISMVCGLVSLVSCYGGFVPGIAAIVLASIAGNKAPGVPNTMTKVGKITGIIGIIVSALCLIGYIVLVAIGTVSEMGSSYSYYY